MEIKDQKSREIDYTKISELNQLNMYYGKEITIPIVTTSKVNLNDRRFRHVDYIYETYILEESDCITKLVTYKEEESTTYKIIIGGETHGYIFKIKTPIYSELSVIFKEGVDFLLKDQRPWISNLVHLHIRELNKIINTLIDLNYE